MILKNHKADYSVENIVNYFTASDNEIDDVLVEFINESSAKTLDFTAVFSNDKQSEAFFDAVVLCKPLKNDKYRMLLKSQEWSYSEFTLESLTDEKLRVLIELNKIEMTSTSLLCLRSHYADVLFDFIKAAFDEYLDLMPYSFDIDEADIIIGMSDVPDVNKLKLLAHMKDPISIKDKHYSEEVTLHILANNLDDGDVPFFIEAYSNFSALVQDKVAGICVDHYHIILQQQKPIALPLFDKIMHAKSLPTDIREEMFAISLPLIHEMSQCIGYLKLANLVDFEKLFNNGRPKIPVSTIHERILDYFQSKHWIKRFSHDTEHADCYKIEKMNRPEDKS